MPVDTGGGRAKDEVAGLGVQPMRVEVAQRGGEACALPPLPVAAMGQAQSLAFICARCGKRFKQLTELLRHKCAYQRV